MNVPELALKSGLTKEAFYQGFKDPAWAPSRSKRAGVAKALGVSEAWLMSGVSEGIRPNVSEVRPLSQMPEIPLYDMQRISAGEGATLVYDEPLEQRAIAPEFVQMARGRLAMIRAEGASMEPLIHDGAELIVDFHAITEPRPGIYVIQVDNQLSVKDIEMLPGRVLVVKSRNPAYLDQTFTESSTLTVRIVGRVLGQQQKFW